MRNIIWFLTLAVLVSCSDAPSRRASSPADGTSDGTAGSPDVAPGDAAGDAAGSVTADTGGAPDSGSADSGGAPDGGADTGVAPDSGASPDADVAAPPPNISVALDCGNGPPTGPGNAGELQRLAIDLEAFPDALCNDGSGAVLYFRPYVGEENRHRWVINLNGGGSCASGPACAARWCWCRGTGDTADGCPFAETTTNFSMANMDSDDRPSIGGTGIFRRGDPTRPNPIGDYNQVRVVYCSSDTWGGDRRDAPLEADHPKTGEPVEFSVHFLGMRILDAALATLRRDGVGAPRYTVAGDPHDLPDLDDATMVLLTGDSAGGAGVIRNLDRVAKMLREENTGCQGADCPLVVRGLMDAIVGPELARLDFSDSFLAEFGGTTYEDYLTFLETVPQVNQGATHEESCEEWHAANAPGTEAECADPTHVVRHHVTTPFFVRMALLDNLIMSGYVESGYADPELGPLTPEIFAVVLQRELAEFPKLPETAEEGDTMTVAPGVFAPGCTKHDTIHDDGEVYKTSITPKGGTPLTLFDVLVKWSTGGSPTSVLTMSKTLEDTSCAPD